MSLHPRHRPEHLGAPRRCCTTARASVLDKASRRPPPDLSAARLGRARRRGDLAERRWPSRRRSLTAAHARLGRPRSASASPTSARRSSSSTAAPAGRCTTRSSGSAGAATPSAERTAAGRHGRLVHRKTGLQDRHAISPARSSPWLMRERPDTRGASCASGEALIGTIDAYLIYRLTGGRVFATDHTNASRTLLFDIHAPALGRGAVRLFGVPLRALPEVRDSTGRFGETDVGGVLPAAGPDLRRDGRFAGVAVRPAVLRARHGEGHARHRLVRAAEHRRTLRHRGAAACVTTLAWTHAASRRMLRRHHQLLRRDDRLAEGPARPDQRAAETEALARSRRDNGGVYLVPAFAGLGAPYWSPDARAADRRADRATATRRHVIRAALESIAYQIRDVLEMMQDDGGVDARGRSTPTAARRRTGSSCSSSPTCCGLRARTCRRTPTAPRWARRGRDARDGRARLAMDVARGLPAERSATARGWTGRRGRRASCRLAAGRRTSVLRTRDARNSVHRIGGFTQ